MGWRHYATLDVVGLPKPQPRVKAAAFGGHAHVYTPETAKSWKQLIMYEAAPLSGRMTNVPFKVSIEFRLPRPKARKHETYAKGKPDIDNLIKSTMDALSDCGVWRDDSLVVFVSAWKMYVGGGELKPGAGVTLEIWQEE